MHHHSYHVQRAGYRLEPQPYSQNHHESIIGDGLSAPSIMGTGHLTAPNLYGGHARPDRARVAGGMLPGEYLVPHHKMQEAIHHYKTLRGLHDKHLAPHHLPHMHPLHIIERHLHHLEKGGGPRGGLFPFLPMLAGAAVPLIGEAVKGLIGGFSHKGGEHIASAIAGRGLHLGIPRVVHTPKGMHFHLHGEGFLDLLKRAMHHAKRIFTSEPAKKIGSHAIKTLTEALMHAITEKMQNVQQQMAPAPPATMPTLPLSHRAEFQPLPPGDPGYGTMPRVSNEDETQDGVGDERLDGSGIRRRKRRAPTKKSAPKRSKKAAAMPHHYFPGSVY